MECVEIDQEGWIIVAKLDEDHSIVNIYAPTDYRQQPAFIRTLSQLLTLKNQLIKSYNSRWLEQGIKQIR